MEIQFTTQVFKEGKTFVAHTPELDISSCGETEKEALQHLKEAVRLFLEEADKLGTINQILDEAGFLKHNDTLEGPQFISTQRISLPLPLLHVKEA
jgi:predicted RNase H-like HicB family nuclease